MLPLLWPDIVIGDRKKPAIGCLEVRSKERCSDPPVAFLLIQRQIIVSCFDDGTVASASICIHYQQVKNTEQLDPTPASGDFVGNYCSFSNSVSLTSKLGSGGAVFLDPASLRGNRIGTYLMSEIVAWARQWPDAAVNTVELLSLQAEGANHHRRNCFYENIGLRFSWKDPEHRAGTSFPMEAKDLRVVESWRENLTEVPLDRFITHRLDQVVSMTMQLDDAQRELAFRRKSLSGIEAKPLRWAIRTLHYKFYGTALNLCLLAVFVGVLWFQVF